jgi:4-amino-4-deoxy-L-arabinose transferase
MKKALPILILIYLMIYIIPLGNRQIAIIDEARYGEIPREMIDSGNWVVPHLNGLRYFEKPVLGYWLNAFSMLAFGRNAFAIRFPSALAVGGTALLLFFLVRRATHSKQPAMLAAAMYITFMLVAGIGVTSVLDSMLTFFITGMIVFLYYAYRAEEPSRRLLHLFLCGLFAAASFMTKGFLAFAVPVITIVPFLLWQKDWKRMFTMPWIPLLTAVLLILPWALMIHQREPDYWHYFFWEEHINRFLPDSVNEMKNQSEFWRNLLGEDVTQRLVKRPPQHEEPFWFFVPVLLGGALPWTFVLPAALTGLWHTRKRDPLIRFAICWMVFPFLFFSASSGKLGTYILPCMPALAILGSCGLLRYFGTGANRSFRNGAIATSALFILTALFFIFAYQTGIPEPIFTPEELPKLFMVVTGTLALAGFVLWAGITRGTTHRLMLYAVSPALLLFFAHFSLPNRLAVTESAEDFLMRHQERADRAIVAANKYLAHSTCFFYNRDDIYLFDSRGEFEYGLNYPDSQHRLMTLQRFADMVNDPKRTQPLVILLDTEHFNDRAEVFQAHPPPFRKDEGKLTILEY